LRGFSGELLRQESTGEQAIKDLTAGAREREEKEVVVLAITRVELI
jgi:hypothetical protein